MNRFAHALYCDDIRQELGNKLTLVGIYGTELLVREFPAVLPKFAIFITVASPAANAMKRLGISILRDEELLLEQEADTAELASGLDQYEASLKVPEPERMVQVIKHVLSISPFILNGPSVLRVVVKTEGEELRCPALIIRQQPLAGDLTSDQRPATDIKSH